MECLYPIQLALGSECREVDEIVTKPSDFGRMLEQFIARIAWRERWQNSFRRDPFLHQGFNSTMKLDIYHL